jgi:hypothetical protein
LKRLLFILTESPFTERDYERFGVGYLTKCFHVSILDCTAFIKPQVWTCYRDIAYREDFYLSVMSIKVLKNYMLRLSPQRIVVIDCLGGSVKAEKVRRVLYRAGSTFVRVQAGLLPLVPSCVSKKEGMSAFFKKLVTSNVLWRRASKIGKKAVPIDIAFIGGKAGYDMPLTRLAKICIPAHSFDYDIFLKLRRVAPSKISAYAVFLDEDMVHHSDYVHHGLSPPVSEELYYTELANFFNVLEKKLGMSVIFSAHPRSNYDNRLHVLQGRPYVMGKTAELVKDASLVLLHASTAQSFAVLWKKPMLFLTSDGLNSSWIGPSIDYNASIFNKKPVNLSQDNQIADVGEDCFEIDENCYKNYHEQYLKVPGSEDKTTWELLVNFIDEAKI